MKAFKKVTAVVVSIDRANIDTDAIIPKQFLKSIERTGFGKYLFDEWRYLDKGEPGMDCTNRPLNEHFVLNMEPFKNAEILLVRENFGCGSSREHAPWALEDYGFKVLIAPSFADIFYNNCFKNGILPVVLDSETVDSLFQEFGPGYQLTVDLEAQTITTPSGSVIQFEIDASRKHRLLNGLDDIALTLQDSDLIKAYESNREKRAPWLFTE